MWRRRCCTPELPLFVYRSGGEALFRELLPEFRMPPDTRHDLTHRSAVFFAPAGIPFGLCLLLVLVTCGTATLGFVAFNYDGLQLPPMTWLFLQSLSLYTVYLSFQTLFFERFIACFRIKGNVGFFIVTLDFIGYTGTVVVLVFKEFFNPDINWLDFYNLMSGYVGIVCSVAFLCSAVYLVQRYRKENASGPLDSSLFRLRRWSRPGNSLLLETE